MMLLPKQMLDDDNATTQGTSSLMNMVTSPLKSLEVPVFYPDASADIVNCFNGMPSALRGHDKLSKPKCHRDIKVLASSNINQSRTPEDVALMMVPVELNAGTEMIEKRIPFSTKKKRPNFKTYPLQKKPLRCSTLRRAMSKSRYEAATPEVSLNLIWRRGGDVNPPAVKKEVDVEVAMLRKLFKFHTMEKYLPVLRDQNSVVLMTEIQPMVSAVQKRFTVRGNMKKLMFLLRAGVYIVPKLHADILPMDIFIFGNGGI